MVAFIEDLLHGALDVRFSGKEHKRVLVVLPAGVPEPFQKLVEYHADAVRYLVGVRLRLEREVLDLDIVHTRFYGDYRSVFSGGRVCEESGENLCIQCGGRNYHLELRAFCHDLPEQSQDEVDVEAALMGLVNHYDAVAREKGVGLELLEQHAVCQNLDPGFGIGRVVEPHLVGAVVLREVLRRNLG